MIDATGRQYRVFIVAGEHSGDVLGGKLMTELNRRLQGRIRYLGVGGEDMERQGLVSQFPLSDVAVMGPMSILPRLPRIVRRVYATVASAVAAEPDLVIIIDSPEFTHPIAKRIRKRLPGVPIIDYVSPTVWAWRPGRARKMARYVDHVLALLPFEPAAHKRLAGPPCTYVGHPMIERAEWLAGLPTAPLAERLALSPDRPVIAVLPGSRSSEVSRLMQPFSAAIGLLAERGLAPQVVIPTVKSVRALVVDALKAWPVPAHIVEGEVDKFAAFKLADAALAASGTVTLELAVAGTPMVVAYRVDGLAVHLRFMVKVPSIVLANLVLGENAFPELIQEECTPERLADALELILKDTPERARQRAALSRIGERMRLPTGTPSEAAADVVMEYLAGR
ncbi:MAG: lipid-A-disaccharide synthase [Hyphomicrobiaceae bacterium]|nr:lipid-A-disaccharide synthase [Hyphomicrobiaceae bacterium]